MGDRGNIVIRESGSDKIWFYSHWGGYRLTNTLAEALSNAEGNWNDSPYLNRVIFNTLTKDDPDGTTGYGIDWQMGDGGTEVYVDHDNQKIIYNEDEYSYRQFILKYLEKDSNG